MPTTTPTRKPTARKSTTRQTTQKKAPKPPLVPCYSLAAVRGIQAGCEYYCLMMPVRMLAKSFLETDLELPAERRAQRLPNPRRVKQIADYVTTHVKSYVFSSLTASVRIPNPNDADGFKFIPVGDSDAGILNIPMSAQFLVNDGQHRLAALKAAWKECPELGDETISVVVFQDRGLQRQQQIFHDLNQAAKPNKSIGLAYDHRSEEGELVRQLRQVVPVFERFTDLEKTSVSGKSGKLFTLNGLHSAVKIMRQGLGALFCTPELLQHYWEAVTYAMSDWQAVLDQPLTASEVRRDHVSGHAVSLEALAYLGVELLKDHPEGLVWQVRLTRLNLGQVDWRKSNPDWEGLFIFGGSIRKNKTTAQALGRYLAQRGPWVN
ncbi:MAG: DGQHR domain-containing protein [Synechococcales cyanobacterium RM1_1_8]|nr:DGQHR domain-containing protein [Synechococcales cyanobacterium RM1_1_8]